MADEIEIGFELFSGGVSQTQEKEEEHKEEIPFDLDGGETKEEIVVDEEKKEEDGEVKEETPKKEELGGGGYTEVALAVLGEDILIAIEDEEGETQEIPLSEANLTKEQVAEVLKNYIKEEKDKFKSNSISTEDLDETTLTIMKAVKNSRGNFKELEKLVNLQKDVVDPIKSLDLELESDQEKAIIMKMKSEGQSDKVISAAIKGFKAEDILREEAEEAVGHLSEKVKEEAQRLAKESEEAEKAFQDTLKDYGKQATEKLVSEFNLDPKLAKKISDFAYKETVKNGIRGFDIDYNYMVYRKDPEVSAKLCLFMHDGGKTYEKMIRAEAQLNTNLENKKKLTTIKLTKPQSGGARTGEKEVFIPFEKF